jgi:nickel-dependent lactate racemase
MTYHDISIDYGDQIIRQFIPKGRGDVQVIKSPEVVSKITSIAENLIEVLENPTNSPPLKDLVHKHYTGSGKNILVLADDNTRPNISWGMKSFLIFRI